MYLNYLSASNELYLPFCCLRKNPAIGKAYQLLTYGAVDDFVYSGVGFSVFSLAVYTQRG